MKRILLILFIMISVNSFSQLPKTQRILPIDEIIVFNKDTTFRVNFSVVDSLFKKIVKDSLNNFDYERLSNKPIGGTGTPGEKGDKGDDGYTPIKGVDYFDGTNGTNGSQGIQGIQGVQGNAGTSNYIIHVQALTSSPADGATVYFGNMPKAPITTANVSKVYIPKSGTIKRVDIYCYSGTAGTNENWSLYVRLNNTTDYLIQTKGVNTNERVFTNSSLSISVAEGNYIEIKGVQPTWATNPLTCIYGGTIYIE